MDFHLAPRVLIACGDDTLRRKIERHLAHFGCETEVASEGSTAIDKACASTTDLVFMDCELPSFGGFPATQEVRDREIHQNRHVPIIGVTSETLPTRGEECLEAGMDDYITAPYTNDQVWVALNRWLFPNFPRLKFCDND